MLRVVETIARTDTGRQRRGNEDSSLVDVPLFVVADGMGGAQAGEVASRIAVEAFEQGLPPDGPPEQRLSAVVQRANGEIHRRSRTEAERAGMGTTVTAAYLDGDAVAIAHVGDSRAYLVRDGELRRMTEDHSLVEELVRGGKLTQEEAKDHPQRSIITRALGPEAEVEVDTWTYKLRPGDIVLLCSDGLTSMIPEQQVRDAIIDSGDLDTAARRLIDEANAAGGRDNITVVLFRVEDSESPELVAGTAEHPTEIRLPAPEEAGSGPAGPDPARTAGRAGRQGDRIPPPVTMRPEPTRRAPLARLQGWAKPSMPAGWVQHTEPKQRHFGRLGKFVAGTLAVLAVLFVVGGGGYLASLQLYFLGTNGQGIVTVYQGLPYVLPFGIPMYETFYTSGVPAQTVPADRRSTLLNHAIHDQAAAIKLINDLELGKIQG